MAHGLSRAAASGLLPLQSQLLCSFPVPAGIVWHGLGVGVLVALSGSVLPVARIRKVTVCDVFVGVAS
jgi:hypothetical protein